MAMATTTAILVGAAIGAGVGAVGTYAAGGRGDAIWKSALTGAVGGALTAGVGSWASGTVAGGLGWGSTAAYALGGAAGGIGAGALGTALSGGNSSDYLRNIATGGLIGGATGALGGYLQGGGEAASSALPTDANGIPLTSEGTYAFDDAAQAASGVQTGTTTAPGVEATVTGPTAAPTQGTTTPLADTVSNIAAGSQSLDSGVMNPSVMRQGVEAPAGSFGTSFDTGVTAPSSGTGGFGSDAAGFDVSKGVKFNDGGAAFGSTGSATVPEDSFWNNYFGDKSFVGSQMDAATKGTGMGLEDYLKMTGKAQLIGGGIKALGAIATAPETARNRQQLMDLYNKQNDQNQFYANQLQQTYQNPESYLGSPEAQATRSAALQKALAVNAQAGRRTQGGALSNLLMQEQLKNLQTYRRGIPRPDYGTAAQVYQNAAQYSPTADIFGGVASMATPLSLYSLFPG